MPKSASLGLEMCLGGAIVPSKHEVRGSLQHHTHTCIDVDMHAHTYIQMVFLVVSQISFQYEYISLPSFLFGLYLFFFFSVNFF